MVALVQLHRRDVETGGGLDSGAVGHALVAVQASVGTVVDANELHCR